MTGRESLERFAWLSVAAALVTIVIKGVAYWLTGSVGLLSDALESLVNLAGALMALAMLAVAARPADEEHAYGHGKAEYFSSGVEGALIVVTAVSILWLAVGRLLAPRPLDLIGIGLSVSAVASVINLGVAIVIRRAARQFESITLEADAQHLFTDVLTSAGVIVGVGAVGLTGWQALDPIVAIVIAMNIVYTGFRIVRTSVLGLLDTALPVAEVATVRRVLDGYRDEGIEYHALRTRQAASRRFISVHVLVPGTWTVDHGHQLLERMEAGVRASLPNVTILTHLESLSDPASWEDQSLDRPVPASTGARDQ